MTSSKDPAARDPVILDLDTTPLPDAPSPAEAPPVEDDPNAAERALRMAAKGSAGWGIGRLFWSTIAALVGLAVLVTVSDFVAGLFARHAVLGWVGLALAGLVCVILLVLALRELSALARLGRIEALQRAAAECRSEALVNGLASLYRGRAELEAARDDLLRTRRETPDDEAILTVAETRLMAPLDRRAEAAVARASRDVAAATALIPLAAVDVLAVLLVNIRMIRQIAEIYGGRAGWLGSWRLLKSVAVHLVATGAVAATDDLLGPLLGGGVISKLSRRFGEAAVNAALTARVGCAAIEICRPMPFNRLNAPRASSLVFEALRSWRRTDAPES